MFLGGAIVGGGVVLAITLGLFIIISAIIDYKDKKEEENEHNRKS